MSEECTEYVDHRTFLRRLLVKKAINVHVSRHAVKRLKERATRDYLKCDKRVLLDVIRNIVRDGRYKASTSRLLIWTKRYVLISEILDENTILVKTVISKLVLREELRNILTGGYRAEWKKINVTIHSHQAERM